MANTLQSISMISYVLAVIFLGTAILLFFKFHIIDVIGDLTGRTAKKSIERMRAENEKSGKKTYIPSPVNMKRGKITEAIQNVNTGGSGTLKLNQSPEQVGTKLVAENEVNVASLMTEGTTVLDEGTTLLKEGEETMSLDIESPTVTLKKLDEIILIHTNERI
jgi:hypothetical protein